MIEKRRLTCWDGMKRAAELLRQWLRIVSTLLNDLRQSPVGFLQALYSAAIAAGIHLYPFRTEQLSPPSPMVLTHQLEE